MKVNLSEMRERLFERNWRLTIDIQQLWNSESNIFDADYTEEEFNQFKTKLLKKLKLYTTKINSVLDKEAVFEYEGLLNHIEFSEDLDEFNGVWDDLYDFADYNNIWIKTFV